MPGLELDEGIASDWDGEFEIPDAESAVVDGHRPLATFLRFAKLSLFAISFFISFSDDLVPGGGLLITVAVDGTDELDVVEAMEDDEVTLCGPFRGIKIRVTSSALIEFNSPCALSPEFHPSCGKDWKLVGLATAVICNE